MTRKRYHRSKERIRQAHSGASTMREAARRLALRCGLLQPRQRAMLTSLGDGCWALRVPATGLRYRLDLRCQDYEEVP